MKKLATDIHRVARAGKTIYISPGGVAAADFEGDEPSVPSSPVEIIRETLEIPVVPSEIQLWDGGDRLYPHLHYTCPRCLRFQNSDLRDDDPNPRFGMCDACGWESLVWIEWDESARATMDLDKGKYIAREIASMRRGAPSAREIDELMYSLESFAETHPDSACCLMIELWPIASVSFMHHVCDAIGLWMEARRSPVILARLQELSTSEVDPELMDAALKLLDDLQGD